MNRELKAVLEVYTRKIRTFIDTQISRINTNLRVAYEHLVSRTSKYLVNYDIADRTIWDSEHLLTAITAFSARKISNGQGGSIADGMSLAHILCDSSAASLVTEIDDDNKGWNYTTQFPWSVYTNVAKATLGFKTLTNSNLQIVANYAALTELTLSDAREIVVYGNKGSYGWGKVYNMAHLKKIYWPELTKYNANPDGHSSSYEGLVCQCPELEEFIAPNLSYIAPLPNHTDNAMISQCGALKRIVVGKLTYMTNYAHSSGADSLINTDCPNLIDIEIGAGSACNIRLTKWNPTDKGTTFLQNFREHICQRLANRTGQTKLTLTLSAAVYDAVKGTNGGYASTHTLGEICGESLVLTPLEISLGITENTIYSTWLTTYFGENGINWNIETPN